MSKESQSNPKISDDVASQIASLSPAKRALLELKLKEIKNKSLTGDGIPKRKESSDIPLSFAQQRLWFIDQFEQGSVHYNIPMAWRLMGVLHVDAMQKALNSIIVRHESLRTAFSKVNGEPVQTIAKHIEINLLVLDFSALESERQAKEIQLAGVKEAGQTFDLTKAPLIRCTLLKLSTEEHVLLLTMHHIISDGWSMNVFQREFWALYEAYFQGRPSPLTELPIQYTDFSVWQRQWLQGNKLEKLLEYWKKRLDGAPPVLELPTDRPYPAVQRFCGARHAAMIPAQQLDDLRSFSRKSGCTLYMTLLAAFQLLLHRYTGQQDILVGSPIAARNRSEIENLIGFFVNTLVLRTDFSGNPTGKELLGRVRETALGAFEHQELPFEKLVETLRPERQLGHNPLIQVVFALQNVPQTSFRVAELTIVPENVDTGVAKFDLTLFATETVDGLNLSLDYNTDIFDGATAERMVAHYINLLQGISSNPEQQIAELPFLSDSERHQLIETWNDTRTDYPKNKCVHDLFSIQVKQTPEAVALEFKNNRLTYQELEDRANQLANYLDDRGVGPDVLVGICMDRSLEAVIGILAILKAGGAYVPLDPSYPTERLAFMMADTQIKILLTQEHLLSSLPAYEGTVLCLDKDWGLIAGESKENLDRSVTGDNLAYVMYTSGSTGRPKGVSVTHRGVVRLVKNTNYIDITADDVFLQFAPISFDASTFEIWGALLNGARLVLFPGNIAALHELGDCVTRHSVTILWLTAGLFHEMAAHHIEGLRPVKQLLAGGDVLSPQHVRKVLTAFPGCRLINGYGPTENTTFTCCHVMTAEDPVGRTVPIGRPIANTQVYILDAHLQPVPVGVAGELYIGGDGLARGYLNRPELTAEKFIPDPFGGNPERFLYKTGDLVRYLPDGNIEFLGRKDQQVKIRGFRVEMGEIELVLKQHPAVREAAVLMREDEPGNKRLAAYVIFDDGQSTSEKTLHAFLQSKLPTYMLPSFITIMDSIPLTPNGKVDRNRLPKPDIDRTRLKINNTASADTLEIQLLKIWESVLNVQAIGLKDNFFDLGGHSLLAIKLMAKIEKNLGVSFPVASLFHAPTIEQQADIIKKKGWTPRWTWMVPLRPEGSKPPIFFIHGPDGVERYLEPDQPCFVVLSLFSSWFQGQDKGNLRYNSIERIAAIYISEIKTVQIEGPYYLFGYSMGGLIALEMARQLSKKGQEVPFVFLLDPTTPAVCKGSSHSRFHTPDLIADTENMKPGAFITRKKPENNFRYAEYANLKFMVGRIVSLLKERRKWIQHFLRLKYCQIQVELGNTLPQDLRRFYITHLYRKAVNQFVPHKYPGYVVLFQPAKASADSDWSTLLTGKLETHQHDCPHLELMREPYLRVWSRKLHECVQKVHQARHSD